MRLFILSTTVILSTIFACKPKQDDPAPAAPDYGIIKGELYYVDGSGNDVTLPFSYDYFSADSVNKYFTNGADGYYKINLERGLKNNEDSYIKFSRLYGDNTSAGKPMSPLETDFKFSMNRLVQNQQFRFIGAFYSVAGSRSYCTFKNFSFDTETHKMSFDFEAYFHPDDLDFATRYDAVTPASMKGNVSVTMVEKPWF